MCLLHAGKAQRNKTSSVLVFLEETHFVNVASIDENGFIGI